MGLFRRPKPKAVAWVWDGEQWLRHASYDTEASDYFAAPDGCSGPGAGSSASRLARTAARCCAWTEAEAA